MSYQKFYSNQIHSSSLLCQLSHLWKSQLLCDALIRAGSITIKAHRLVLIAACPMLQSMENASAGSHLEVRLAADIKQESVNTFLQYLYEGFMMLTEENVRDVEKVARLLQVDGVIKCCADFYKSLKVKTGVTIQPGHNYKYSFQDLVEFRHVRASDIIKSTHDRITKRASEFSRPGSPGGKRQRMYMHPGSPSVDRADDHHSMSDSYKTSYLTPDPWERVPRLGSGMGRQGATGRNSQPGVIEIVEDSLEIVQTEPVNKDPNKPSDSRQTVQKSVAISIASQITDSTDLRVVNITGSNRDGSNTTSTTNSSKSSSQTLQDSFQQKSISSSSPLTSLQQSFASSGAMHRMPEMSSHQMPGPSFRQERAPELFHIPNFGSSDLELVQVPKPGKMSEASASTSSSQSQRQPFPVSLSPVGASSKPSFAVGSASQSPSSQPMGSPMAVPTSTPIQPAHIGRSQSQGSSAGQSDNVERASPVVDSGKDPSSFKEKQEPSPSSTAEMTPDISIVKVEGQDKDDTGGLDMYVDMPPDGTMTMHSGTGEESDNDHDEALEEWAREESANEGGDMSQMDPGGAKGCHSYKMEGMGPWSSDRRGQITVIQCAMCGMMFRTKLELSYHVKHECKLFRCRICPVVLRNREEYRAHLASSHDQMIVEFCLECGKGFKSKSGFRIHQNIWHSSVKTCPRCKTCGKYFGSRSRLMVHERKHTSEEAFACLICGKRYRYKSSLKKHTCRQEWGL
ncbi:zinc finger and BTB domain-containing protein 17-like isoform X12 [Ylistrum balloti]|uniref:zinc finger and BTB domain-containing protein 17-like isoform X12 n=1 Tax=Ylistrum balloti TaxID=509963 RepID=UPI002905AB7D|nr:zinc finger and BTB domain-containing protein 17-like isoform X12 [Ylistrum balloti]XP_060086296.1 zinc finger and BTB domain-containing protein 17-like isoform X12 [Ylistrum balloti]